MVDREAESGHELVLDNRKLIIAFVVLIAICGCFFVVGFIEGKRQGFQDGQASAETAHKANPASVQAQTQKPAAADASAAPVKENSASPQLNWPKVVTAGDHKDTLLTAKAATEPAIKPVKVAVKEAGKKPAAESGTKPKPQANAAHSEPVAYSVQVGAFRVRHEVETKAKMLRSQGYDCRIEEPKSPEDFYLLKVGKYTSRAEAIAMRNRLKKSGYNNPFIKTN
jgi:cell division protein FtsN